MKNNIIIEAQYLPATCFVLIQQKYPENWEKLLQPYIAEIKRFTSIYKTKNEALIRLVKIANPGEIELIQAANYQLKKQKFMNFTDELSIINKEVQQYKKQLSALESPENTISQDDKVLIGKHYRSKIEALSVRRTQLIEAIDFEGTFIASSISANS